MLYFLSLLFHHSSFFSFRFIFIALFIPFFSSFLHCLNYQFYLFLPFPLFFFFLCSCLFFTLNYPSISSPIVIVCCFFIAPYFIYFTLHFLSFLLPSIFLPFSSLLVPLFSLIICSTLLISSCLIHLLFAFFPLSSFCSLSNLYILLCLPPLFLCFFLFLLSLPFIISSSSSFSPPPVSPAAAPLPPSCCSGSATPGQCLSSCCVCRASQSSIKWVCCFTHSHPHTCTQDTAHSHMHQDKMFQLIAEVHNKRRLI